MLLVAQGKLHGRTLGYVYRLRDASCSTNRRHGTRDISDGLRVLLKYKHITLLYKGHSVLETSWIQQQASVTGRDKAGRMTDKFMSSHCVFWTGIYTVHGFLSCKATLL